MPGGVTLPEQTRDGGRWGREGMPRSSRRREQKPSQNIPAAEKPRRVHPPADREPCCRNSGHREQEDIYCELSLQKYSLKNHCRSRHCQGAPTAGGGVGRTPPRGRSLQRVEERERPCLGALPAGSGGGVGVVPGLLLHRIKGTPWQGGWSKKRNWARES